MKNNNILQSIETERLLLSEITLDDCENMYHLHSLPEVDKYNTLGIPKSMDTTIKLIKSRIYAFKSVPRSSYVWKITLKENHEFIGEAGLTLSNNKFKLGEIFYILDPKYWGKGYATEVAKTLVTIGFKTVNLHKVEAGVATENTKSIHVLEKLGMTREGLRRKILPIRGQWKDNYHYAIVSNDPRDY